MAAIGNHYQEASQDTNNKLNKDTFLKDKSFAPNTYSSNNNNNQINNILDKKSFGKALEKAQSQAQVGKVQESQEKMVNENRKSEKFVAPQILKQQTQESMTFGVGTPKARSIITPIFGQTPTFRTNASYTSKKSNYKPNSKMDGKRLTQAIGVVSNDNELESESRSPTPLTLEEAIALKVEQIEKTYNKREMYSGKAQYETPLDLNEEFLESARKYGFYRESEKKDNIESTSNSKTTINTNSKKIERKTERKTITLRDVIQMDACDYDEPIDQFFDENENDSD